MKTLGQGGFGKAKLTIYKGKRAVVKYVNSSGDPRATLATNITNRQDAKKEGEIMKLFNSNYIAEIYGIEGHAIYMKYYNQGSLREIIDKGEAKKGRYFLAKQICQGVKDIHALNYVHSDLKCSNILVEKKFSNGNLSLFISDFGVAGLKGSWPITCTIGFYPKNFFSKPLCFEDDIFALGKLFIELFARIEDDEIELVNYNNFKDIFDVWAFSDNFKEHDRYNRCNELRELIHRCISEYKYERPTLETLLNFFEKNWY